MATLSRVKRWLLGDRAPRYSGRGLVAAYWSPGTSQLHPVKDISLTGAYLGGSISWPIGTFITGIIRHEGHSPEVTPQPPVLSIEFRVVRHGPDGMGVCFLPHTEADQAALTRLVLGVASASGGAVS